MSIVINIGLTSALLFVVSCLVGSFAHEIGSDKTLKWSLGLLLISFVGMISSIIIAIWS